MVAGSEVDNPVVLQHITLLQLLVPIAQGCTEISAMTWLNDENATDIDEDPVHIVDYDPTAQVGMIFIAVMVHEC